MPSYAFPDRPSIPFRYFFNTLLEREELPGTSYVPDSDSILVNDDEAV